MEGFPFACDLSWFLAIEVDLDSQPVKAFDIEMWGQTQCIFLYLSDFLLLLFYM